MHVLILGITATGKTTFAFNLARRYRENGTCVLVLDPDLRKEWQADFITDDPARFMSVVKVNTSCALFIDESGQTIGRYAGEMEWLATQARKWGHKSHFITQRASQLGPTVRNQCSTVIVFKQSVTDSKIIASEFVADEFIEACNLKAGEYLGKHGVDGPVFRGKAW